MTHTLIPQFPPDTPDDFAAGEPACSICGSYARVVNGECRACAIAADVAAERADVD